MQEVHACTRKRWRRNPTFSEHMDDQPRLCRPTTRCRNPSISVRRRIQHGEGRAQGRSCTRVLKGVKGECCSRVRRHSVLCSAAAVYVDQCKSGETMSIATDHTTSTLWLDMRRSQAGQSEWTKPPLFVSRPRMNRHEVSHDHSEDCTIIVCDRHRLQQTTAWKQHCHLLKCRPRER
jgi:hypothetical protein